MRGYSATPPVAGEIRALQGVSGAGTVRIEDLSLLWGNVETWLAGAAGAHHVRAAARGGLFVDQLSAVG